MIITGKQAREALKEIRKLTKWTTNKISEKAGISNLTIMLIEKNVTSTPQDSTLESIDNLLNEVKESQK